MPDDNRPYESQAPTPPGGESAPQQPGPGFRLGEYTILEMLGHGSMATVYLARDATGHDVALKLFQEGPGVSPTLLERFRREAEASKKLRRHPHIMKVYATGREGIFHYIVMEPIRNSRTLDDLVHTTSLTKEEIVEIVIKISRALHYAHSRSIVHRDVKPTNIMIDEFGEPMLTDFGVAALIDWPSCTISGALTGTPLYMSPEQARADRVGPASDIYSLGVVLYEALTGILPYSTQHSAPVKNVLEAVRHEAPRRPRSLRRDLSPDLEAVVLKALAKEPDHRYADAEAFANDLDRAQEGRPVSARPFSRWEHLRVMFRRYDQVVVTLFMVAVMAAGAVWYFRTRLLAAQYDKLINIVRLRSYAMGAMPAAADGENAASRALVKKEIDTARSEMRRRRPAAAEAALRKAIDLMKRPAFSSRQMAQARLELAESLSAQYRWDDALAEYRLLLANRDWPDPPAGLAQLDAIVLALLRGDREAAEDIRNIRRDYPKYGPLGDAVRCLEGKLSAESLEKGMSYIPSHFAIYRNDLYLAIAVRHKLDGRDDLYASALMRCLNDSSPPEEWPAPLVRRLKDGEATPRRHD
jgi:hypothetical protein